MRPPPISWGGAGQFRGGGVCFTYVINEVSAKNVADHTCVLNFRALWYESQIRNHILTMKAIAAIVAAIAIAKQMTNL